MSADGDGAELRSPSTLRFLVKEADKRVGRAQRDHDAAAAALAEVGTDHEALAAAGSAVAAAADELAAAEEAWLELAAELEAAEAARRAQRNG